jgi:uncharacterized alpha-E superfamily protein
MIHNRLKPGSLASVLNAVGRVAGIVRDRISTDMWRVLRDLNRSKVQSPIEGLGYDAANWTLSDELDNLNEKVLTLAAFGGLATESVTRGEGWRFLEMGRKIERAMHLLEIVRVVLVQPTEPEGPNLEAFLEIADSAMTYRRRYQGSVQVAPVLDLLLLDETNPRSLAFQMAALGDIVEALPRDPHQLGRTAEQRLMLASLTRLRVTEIQLLAQKEERGRRRNLDELVGLMLKDLPALSDAITQSYLYHLEPPRHLSGYAGA